jgi:hypothetical protein
LAPWLPYLTVSTPALFTAAVALKVGMDALKAKDGTIETFKAQIEILKLSRTTRL